MFLYDAKEPIEITVVVKRGERTATFTGLRALGIAIEEDRRSHLGPPTRLAIIAEEPLIDEQTGVLYTITVAPPLAEGEEF